MITKYQTPGAYYERADAGARRISPMRMDIAGFVGIAARGPIDTPVSIQSWRQFKAYFGDFTGVGYLAFAVRGFFENGGRRCWVVRVASRDTAAESKYTLKDKNSSGKEKEDVWRIAAYSPGTWGNKLSVLVRKTNTYKTVTSRHHFESQFSFVSRTEGFISGTLVRLSQVHPDPQKKPLTALKVISGVDYDRKRIIWVHEKPELGLRYDKPLSGFNPDQPIFIESVEYTIMIKESGRLIAQYGGLSLVPEHPRYGPLVLPPLEIPQVFDARMRMPSVPQPIVIEELRKKDQSRRVLSDEVSKDRDISSNQFNPLRGGSDGLTDMKVYDFMGEDISPMDSDTVKGMKRRGIRALELVDEIGIVAAPDIHIQPIEINEKKPPPPEEHDPCISGEISKAATPVKGTGSMELPPTFRDDDIYRVQSALIQHCEERRDRLAILDVPYSLSQNDIQGISGVRAWRSRFDSRYAAFYYPWLKVVNPLRTSSADITRDIPPSGHVAGQYARNDFDVGVHKAPANSPFVWVQDVICHINDEVHGILNPLGINAIRPFPGRGIRIYGARTMSSDPDWRYVNVQRLIMMIKKAVDVSIQWSVFEPNNDLTRAKIRLSLTSYFIQLWQQGALMGSTTEQAFFVKCDGENNPPYERDNGRLIADIGVAPSNPFEFVVLRVGRAENEYEITELFSNSGGLSWQ